MRLVNKDTFKHIIVSTALCVILSFASSAIEIGAMSTLILGVFKEILDHLKKKKNTYLESFIDMIANAIGILAGIVIYVTFLL